MIMDTGVDAGSMLVPELVCASSSAMSVVGAFDMSIAISAEVAGAVLGMVIWAECGFIPGISGMEGCFVWA
jgi:hypothetical protein